MKVLIVDDQPLNRKLPMTMLTRAGIACCAVSSGQQALAMLGADPEISHVLLDVSMPGMSGTEVCAILRGEASPAAACGLRIIAYTAHAFTDEKAAIMRAGFDDLLIKPITQERLNKALGLA